MTRDDSRRRVSVGDNEKLKERLLAFFPEQPVEIPATQKATIYGLIKYITNRGIKFSKDAPPIRSWTKSP